MTNINHVTFKVYIRKLYRLGIMVPAFSFLYVPAVKAISMPMRSMRLLHTF